MHYDVKQKLNKIDSQQYRNLKVPEIDWKLNEAIGLFIKNVAEPKLKEKLEFEISHRVVDDIRTIVVNDESLTLSKLPTNDYLAELPSDYLYYIGMGDIKIKKGGCEVFAERTFERTHGEDPQSDIFQKSSFIWREVNLRFYDKGIKIFTSDEFEVIYASLEYIKKPAFVHNAQDYQGGTYKSFDGTNLVGSMDCDLPSETHSEIVDIAVAMITGELMIPDYQIKKDKLVYNQIN